MPSFVLPHTTHTHTHAHTHTHTQRHVTGSVDLQLHKGNVINVGRSSPLSLYSQDLVSMDKEGGFDATLSTGFIKTLATRVKANKARDALPGAPQLSDVYIN